MTEQEAIKHAREYIKYLNHSGWEKDFDAIDTLIVATEELQKYRAIGGTPELIEKVVHFLCDVGDNSIIKDLELLNQYKLLGTVEEFKTLKEKNEPKKSCGCPYWSGGYSILARLGE